MDFVVPPSIAKKLDEKHGVTEDEIRECFSNIPDGGFLVDTREEHETTPPTHWFIAQTDHGRELCVCFIQMKNFDILIKTAFEPSEVRKQTYSKLTKKQ